MTTAIAQPLAQRKASTYPHSNNHTLNTTTLLERLTYGVPAPRRMLSPGHLLKKHDYIVDFLRTMGFTPSERCAIFYLLRLYTYYGRVYPKAPNFTEDFYCSKRSFWRAIAKLEEMGVVDRINRYLHHLQISNCYRLDKLVLCIMRYLAEHGSPYVPDFAHDLLSRIGISFWKTIWTLRVRLRDPKPLTIMA